MEPTKNIIERINKLANRNKELTEQVKGLKEWYEDLQRQNEKYHNLLQTYSDEDIDEQLKIVPRRKVKRFKMVSILYATMKGFKKLNGHPKAQELLDALDVIYLKFDEIAERYGVLKVKTIGDTFLFAGGVLEENHTNPIDVINTALEMRKAVMECKVEGVHQPFWNISIGIHTGPSIGEPTGKKKLPYNLTGESVNFASRVGMACPTGCINISMMTYELVKEFFALTQTGQMPAKYKGLMDMFIVDGILPELSLNSNGMTPNRNFKTKYHLIQFIDLQEHVLDEMEQKLPANLYYHNIKHTIDVITEVELIGWAEGLSEEQILILKLAGLFHDAGHTRNYKDHELHGTHIAREILGRYDYSDDMIEDICRLIMATKFPPQPKDIMEQVICDSDLDYLGRSDFIPVSNTLYDELKERDMIGTIDEWNEHQLAFIRGHQYFTHTARSLREVNKQIQIERIESLLQTGS